jgi:hypothetical protein
MALLPRIVQRGPQDAPIPSGAPWVRTRFSGSACRQAAQPCALGGTLHLTAVAHRRDELASHGRWERPGLSRRDRSLITCALVAFGKTEQMGFQFPCAIGNGIGRDELIEMVPPWRSTPAGRAPCPQ